MEILGLGIGIMIIFPVIVYIISLIVVLKFISHMAEGNKTTFDWIIIIFGSIFAFIPGTNTFIAFVVLVVWLFNKITKLNTIGEIKND
jgi:hypothetical protein